MAEGVSLSIVFVFFLAFAGLVIFVYRFSNRKLMARLSELRKKNEDLVQVIERLYQTRLNDNRELKKRLDELEEKVDALSRPHPREREVELERVFSRRR